MTEDQRTLEQEASSQRLGRLNRRSFLNLLARGSVAAAVTAAAIQTIRFLSYKPAGSDSTILPLGQPDEYPRKSLSYVAEARLYVGHDDSGLFALDAVCPHLGCLVESLEDGGFMCPCHDSFFDAEGHALSGPATRPLQHLYLWFDEEQGQLMVDRSSPVGSAVRLVI